MNATYVFCVVAAPRPPRPTRARGLQGMGALRILPLDRRLFAVVADAPLERYGEAAVNRRLSDLSWVAGAAVAHEKVVERFLDAPAVLPMKLFTLFSSDQRAIDHLRGESRRLAAAARRVANHDEWGIRVLFDRTRAEAARAKPRKSARGGGTAYLAGKKASRDAVAELAARAQRTVADLQDRLAAKATGVRHRSAEDLPSPAGSLLLDAAFLVPRGKAASFRALAARQARALEPHGYRVTLTGPWPAYSFVEDS